MRSGVSNSVQITDSSQLTHFRRLEPSLHALCVLHPMFQTLVDNLAPFFNYANYVIVIVTNQTIKVYVITQNRNFL